MDNKEPGSIHRFFNGCIHVLEGTVGRVSRLFDRIIYSDRGSLVISGLIAVLICVAVNSDDLSYRLFNKDAATLNLPAVPVEVLVDENNYEVSGVPPTADITVVGDGADIQLVRTQNSASVTADLRNAAEGSNTIALTASGLPTGLDITVNPETVNAVLAKKYSKTFFISSDLIVGAGQSANAYQKPVLSTRSVTIKATRNKLNSIRFVRAIVDTSGYEGSFQAEVPLVAYDSAGKQVSVSISPSTVTADVRLVGEGTPSTPRVEDKSESESKGSVTSAQKANAKVDSAQALKKEGHPDDPTTLK